MKSANFYEEIIPNVIFKMLLTSSFYFLDQFCTFPNIISKHFKTQSNGSTPPPPGGATLYNGLNGGGELPPRGVPFSSFSYIKG